MSGTTCVSAPVSLLDAALGYAQDGMSIIPIHGNKQPACRSWLKYQQQPPTRQETTRHFAPETVTGLAVILGPVSGDLCCRDFDVEQAYHLWAAAYPDWATILPTVKTHRGYHVYFCHRGILRTRKLGDGELRGEGSYVLLPPSQHPAGGVYAWRIPFTRIEAYPDVAGLSRRWAGEPDQPQPAPANAVEGDTEDTEATDVIEETNVPDATQETEATEVVDNLSRVCATLPAKPSGLLQPKHTLAEASGGPTSLDRKPGALSDGLLLGSCQAASR
jgi:Bifunctional DNA primase/polymerase, N-terminal